MAQYAVGQAMLVQGRYALHVMNRTWSFPQITVVTGLAKPGAQMGMKTSTQEQRFQLVEADDVPPAFEGRRGAQASSELGAGGRHVIGLPRCAQGWAALR